MLHLALILLAVEPVTLGTLDGWPGDHSISHVAWSPDGKWIAYAGFEDIHVIDANTGAVVRSVNERCIGRLSFSRDSSKVSCGSALVDIKSGATKGIRTDTRIVARSPDGELALLGGIPALLEKTDGALVKLDMGEKPIKGDDREKNDIEHAQRVNARFSPDGKYVVVPGRNAVGIFKTSNGALVGTIAQDLGRVSPLVGGDVVIMPTPGPSFLVFSLSSGKMLRRFDVPGLRNTHSGKTALTHDGKHFVVLDYSGSGLVDVASGEVRRALSSFPNRSPSAIAISPDGKRIAIADSGAPIAVYTIEGEEQGFPQRHGGPVLSAMMSKDGRRIVTTARDGTRIWSSDGTLLHFGSGLVGAAWISDDGKTVLVGGDSVATIRENGKTWTTTGAATLPLRGRALFAPDGKSLWVHRDFDKLVRIDAVTGQVLERSDSRAMPHDTTLAVDGTGALWIASLRKTPHVSYGKNNTFQTLDLPMPESDARLREMYRASPIAVSPDGQRLAWIARAGWLTTTMGKPLHPINAHSAVFLDNARLAVVDGSTLNIIDANTGKTTRSFGAPRYGKLLGASSRGDAVLISTGAQLVVFPLDARSPAAQPNPEQPQLRRETSDRRKPDITP